MNDKVLFLEEFSICVCMFVGLCVWLHVSVVHLLKDNVIEYGRGKVPKSGSQNESG